MADVRVAGEPLFQALESERAQVEGAVVALDSKLDLALRPASFDEFVGQERIVHNLSVYVEAARLRAQRSDCARPLDHVLLSGGPGLGKTTLAHLLANELGVGFKGTSGPAIERPGDLAGILTHLGHGDVLFIDEIHRLSNVVEEYLYSAMEDFEIDIMIDQGPGARSIKMHLKPFTLVGATTREGLLTAPLRSRFGVLEKLAPYPSEELERIVLRSARLLGVEISPPAAQKMAERARGTPRIANRYLRRVADVAEVRGGGEVDVACAEEGLRMLGVDERGLDPMDRRILALLCQQMGPVGLKTIATAVGEEETTIAEVYEPFLIRRGLITKTPRGRCATAQAYGHLGLELPTGSGQRSLPF